MTEGKKVCRKKPLYVKRMPIEDLIEFMVARQEWNLAPTHLELLTETVDGGKGGDLSRKAVAVEGTDGVIYSGVAETCYHWIVRDSPALVISFVLGKNQQDAKPLDDRMRELGYNADNAQLSWSEE